MGRLYTDNRQLLREEAEFEEKYTKELEEWWGSHPSPRSMDEMNEFLFKKGLEKEYFYDQMLIKQFIYEDVRSENNIFDYIFNELDNKLNHFIDDIIFRIGEGDHINMHFKYKRKIEKIKQEYQADVNKEKEKEYRLLLDLFKRRIAIKEKHRYEIMRSKCLDEHNYELYKRYGAIQKKEGDLKLIWINKIIHDYYNNIERFRTQCSKNLRKIREAEIKEEKFLMKRN